MYKNAIWGLRLWSVSFRIEKLKIFIITLHGNRT